jgi:small subunit ribosomal protein S2
MAVPSFTMRQLLEAGVHFGHQTSRWNPKMKSYLFGVRSGVHIIDLQQTVPLLYRALEFVHEIASKGGRVLFVGTKRQASVPIAEAAGRCGQYYVNHRWLGGMLTNWKTISNSISRLKKLDDQLSEENLGLTKKELLNLTREREKLDRSLGGIREMGGLPDVVVVIDTNKEEIAVHEANKLNIPVIAIIDSNSNPQGIQYPIPGNDDATRAIITYCELIAQSILSGLQKELAASGVDLGSSLEAQEENIPELAQADDLVDTSVDLEGTAPVGEAKTEEVSNLEGTAPVGEAKTEEVPNLEVTEASGN